MDAMPNVVVRRGTRPDIPDAVGKNLEGDSWVIVFTSSRKAEGKIAYTKSVEALKMFRSRQCKTRALWLKLIASSLIPRWIISGPIDTTSAVDDSLYRDFAQ